MSLFINLVCAFAVGALLGFLTRLIVDSIKEFFRWQSLDKPPLMWYN